MACVILTSSFNTVARELYQKSILPNVPQRVAFIATAGDIYHDRPWIDADRKALEDLGYTIFDLGLKGKSAEQLRGALGVSDIIFVAGGNTTYLFECAHASGFSSIIHDVLSAGRTYIGSSAGSILAGPTVEPFVEEDRSELPKNFVLHNPNGLHLVDYVVLPHYPRCAESNDRIERAFGDRYAFVKMTDQEYRLRT